MRFKGQLLLPDEPGPGLRVDLELADQRLAVMSDRERLGAWPLDTVEVRRVGSDTFAMTLAGEPLHFVADDTVSFAYSGIPAIEKVGAPAQNRSPLRGFFGRLWSGASEKPELDRETPSQTTGSAVELSQREAEEMLPIEPITEDAGTVPGAGPEPRDRVEPKPEPAPSPPEYEIVTEEWASLPSELDWPVEQPVDEEPVTRPVSQPVPDKGAEEEPAAEVIELTELERSSVDEHPHQNVEEGVCPALRIDGLPCRSPTIGPSGYCLPHDPDRPIADDLRKALEARARLKRKGAGRLNRVYSRLDKALRQVEEGDLDPEKAIAMAQLARTMCAILEMDEERLTDSGEDSNSDT